MSDTFTEDQLKNFFDPLIIEYKGMKTAYENRLKNFFEPLIIEYKGMKTAKKIADKYLASDFNVIDDLIKTDENKISDIMKILLEKDGKHGQGDKFLKLFLKKCEELSNNKIQTLKYSDYKKIRIEREKSIKDYKRIDVLITFSDKSSDRFAIAIENKPWAREQIDQLENYDDYLKSKYEKNYLLIYMDGLGRESETLKDKKKKISEGLFLETSYQELLIPWLKECKKECESDKIRWFLIDLILWLEKEFRNSENDKTNEEKEDKNGNQ